MSRLIAAVVQDLEKNFEVESEIIENEIDSLIIGLTTLSSSLTDGNFANKLKNYGDECRTKKPAHKVLRAYRAQQFHVTKAMNVVKSHFVQGGPQHPYPTLLVQPNVQSEDTIAESRKFENIDEWVDDMVHTGLGASITGTSTNDVPNYISQDAPPYLMRNACKNPHAGILKSLDALGDGVPLASMIANHFLSIGALDLFEIYRKEFLSKKGVTPIATIEVRKVKGAADGTKKENCVGDDADMNRKSESSPQASPREIGEKKSPRSLKRKKDFRDFFPWQLPITEKWVEKTQNLHFLLECVCPTRDLRPVIYWFETSLRGKFDLSKEDEAMVDETYFELLVCRFLQILASGKNGSTAASPVSPGDQDSVGGRSSNEARSSGGGRSPSNSSANNIDAFLFSRERFGPFLKSHSSQIGKLTAMAVTADSNKIWRELQHLMGSVRKRIQGLYTAMEAVPCSVQDYRDWVKLVESDLHARYANSEEKEKDEIGETQGHAETAGTAAAGLQNPPNTSPYVPLPTPHEVPASTIRRQSAQSSHRGEPAAAANRSQVALANRTEVSTETNSLNRGQVGTANRVVKSQNRPKANSETKLEGSDNEEYEFETRKPARKKKIGSKTPPAASVVVDTVDNPVFSPEELAPLTPFCFAPSQSIHRMTAHPITGLPHLRDDPEFESQFIMANHRPLSHETGFSNNRHATGPGQGFIETSHDFELRQNHDFQMRESLTQMRDEAFIDDPWYGNENPKRHKPSPIHDSACFDHPVFDAPLQSGFNLGATHLGGPHPSLYVGSFGRPERSDNIFHDPVTGTDGENPNDNGAMRFLQKRYRPDIDQSLYPPGRETSLLSEMGIGSRKRRKRSKEKVAGHQGEGSGVVGGQGSGFVGPPPVGFAEFRLNPAGFGMNPAGLDPNLRMDPEVRGISHERASRRMPPLSMMPRSNMNRPPNMAASHMHRPPESYHMFRATTGGGAPDVQVMNNMIDPFSGGTLRGGPRWPTQLSSSYAPRAAGLSNDVFEQARIEQIQATGRIEGQIRTREDEVQRSRSSDLENQRNRDLELLEREARLEELQRQQREHRYQPLTTLRNRYTDMTDADILLQVYGPGTMRPTNTGDRSFASREKRRKKDNNNWEVDSENCHAFGENGGGKKEDGNLGDPNFLDGRNRKQMDSLEHLRVTRPMRNEQIVRKFQETILEVNLNHGSELTVDTASEKGLLQLFVKLAAAVCGQALLKRTIINWDGSQVQRRIGINTIHPPKRYDAAKSRSKTKRNPFVMVQKQNPKSTTSTGRNTISNGLTLTQQRQLYWQKLPRNSHLSVVVGAGVAIFPRILQFAALFQSDVVEALRQHLTEYNADENTEYDDGGEGIMGLKKRRHIQPAPTLGMELELPDCFVYRSSIVCPVTRTHTQQPYLLVCGHVISKQTMERLGKRRQFKCPICPQLQTSSQAKKLRFCREEHSLES